MQTSNDIFYLIKDLLAAARDYRIFSSFVQRSIFIMMMCVVSFLTRAISGRFVLRKISIFRQTFLRHKFDTVRRLENTAPEQRRPLVILRPYYA